MEKFSCKPYLKGCFVRLRLGFDIPEHIAPVRRWGEGRRERKRMNEKARDKAKGDTVNLPSNEFQGTFPSYALKPKSAVTKGGGGEGEDDNVYG